MKEPESVSVGENNKKKKKDKDVLETKYWIILDPEINLQDDLHGWSREPERADKWRLWKIQARVPLGCRVNYSCWWLNWWIDDQFGERKRDLGEIS